MKFQNNVTKKIISYRNVLIIVHYDTCDLSGPLLHGVKLAPERSECDKHGAIIDYLSHGFSM